MLNQPIQLDTRQTAEQALSELNLAETRLANWRKAQRRTELDLLIEIDDALRNLVGPREMRGTIAEASRLLGTSDVQVIRKLGYAAEHRLERALFSAEINGLCPKASPDGKTVSVTFDSDAFSSEEISKIEEVAAAEGLTWVSTRRNVISRRAAAHTAADYALLVLSRMDLSRRVQVRSREGVALVRMEPNDDVEKIISGLGEKMIVERMGTGTTLTVRPAGEGTAIEITFGWVDDWRDAH